MREVERLEKRRVQVAKDTAWSKRRAVEALCAESHIAVPPCPHGFQEALQQGNEIDFDLVSSLLVLVSNLLRAIQEQWIQMECRSSSLSIQILAIPALESAWALQRVGRCR